ncbi:MAG: 50S ribosomal protein L10 [bacterium]|nr:50S ribosomal protein L10 [bacterium]
MSVVAETKGRLATGRAPRENKVKAVEELQKRISEASILVLFDYRGLSVSQMTELRRQLREAGVELSVVKNTLVSRALGGTPNEVLREKLTGPISIATAVGDPTVPARVLNDFLKGLSAGEIRGGALEGEFLDPAKIKELAMLPSREVLLSQMLGAMEATVAGLPRVLNAIILKLLYGLQAIAKEKENVA